MYFLRFNHSIKCDCLCFKILSTESRIILAKENADSYVLFAFENKVKYDFLCLRLLNTDIYANILKHRKFNTFCAAIIVTQPTFCVCNYRTQIVILC